MALKEFMLNSISNNQQTNIIYTDFKNDDANIFKCINNTVDTGLLQKDLISFQN